MKQIPFLGGNALDGVLAEVFREIVQSHQTGEVAALAHLFVYLVRHLFGFVPLSHVGLDLSIYPGADFGP